MKKILICLFAYLLIFAFAGKAFAQSVSLGIYPPIVQIDSTPPADIKTVINLQNFSDSISTINISIKAFQAAQSNDGQIELLNDYSNFIDPFFINRVRILDDQKRITSLTLSPKQKKNLAMQIQIPKNQPHGDYYFTVIFSTVAQSSTLSNSTLQSGGVAMNVLLTIGPKGKNQAVIQDFSTPIFANSGPVPFNVLIYNKSDHFITPSGEIIITNMFGQNVGKVNLLPVNILSNSTRFIPDSKYVNEERKEYKSPVAIWPEKFLIGPYTAKLSLSLSENSPALERSITFFAFPFSYLIAVLLILAITVFIIFRVKSKL